MAPKLIKRRITVFTSRALRGAQQRSTALHGAQQHEVEQTKPNFPHPFAFTEVNLKIPRA
jgi:hypothetical protein